ncbi:hypothetical protein [Burkholderia seminalis]|uniref:hypothetical protein n=1 Tax=Burkholderia seminalis TaxID=488731 RepID=UPI00114D013A|nr:hypothetical protein [Burkholderia seminalis]
MLTRFMDLPTDVGLEKSYRPDAPEKISTFAIFDGKRRITRETGRLASNHGLGRCGREDDNIRMRANMLGWRPMARGESAIGHGGSHQEATPPSMVSA